MINEYLDRAIRVTDAISSNSRIRAKIANVFRIAYGSHPFTVKQLKEEGLTYLGEGSCHTVIGLNEIWRDRVENRSIHLALRFRSDIRTPYFLILQMPTLILKVLLETFLLKSFQNFIMLSRKVKTLLISSLLRQVQIFFMLPQMKDLD